MAQLLDLSMPESELVFEFIHHTHPEIMKANAPQDVQWIGGGHLLATSTTLKEACLFLVSADLAQKRAKQNITLGGYPQIPFKVQERLLKEFTNVLQWFKYEIQEQDSPLRRDDTLMTTAIYVYLCGLTLGSELMPFFTNGTQDLAGLCRSIRKTHHSFSGEHLPPTVIFPVVPERMRVKLPREEDLWAVLDHILVDENIPSMFERRQIRATCSNEVHAIIELFNQDAQYHSISHFSAWCIFNSDKFNELRQEENPYSMIIIAYYLAYCHLFHSFGWWRDRARYDLYDVVEFISDEYFKFVQWPLSVVETFKWTHEDLWNGRFRKEAEKMKSFR